MFGFSKTHLVRLTAVVLLAGGGPGAAATHTDPTGFTTILTKIADLPGGDPDDPGKNPRNSRSSILQAGSRLWFTTVQGGDYIDQGSISSYDLIDQQMRVEYSFGLPIPDDPQSARKDGYMPYSGVTPGQGPYSGQLFYTTRYGGENWYDTGQLQSNNGGSLGVFNPQTGESTVLWSGQSPNPGPNQVYASPVFVSNTSGAFLYFLTNQGGTGGPSGNFGTIQKLDLSTNVSSTVSNFHGSAYDGSPGTTIGRQPQGGMLSVGQMIYFGTPSGGDNPPTAGRGTFQVLNTATDQIEILATTIESGIYNTPVHDAVRDAVYAVTLNKGIYKWDITTGMGEILPNSLGSGNVFANPILFADSIFYATQGGSNQATNGGKIWRYDLVAGELFEIYDLTGQNFGTTSNQSASFSLVTENGEDFLYFLTYQGGANNAGTLMRIEVTAVPEPASGFLALVAGLVLFARRSRRR